MQQVRGETIGEQTAKTYKQAVAGNGVTALQLGSGKGKLPISQLAPCAKSTAVLSNITWEELRDATDTGREFIIAVDDWGHATFHVHNDLFVQGQPDVFRLVADVGDKTLMYKCSSSDNGATVTWSNLIVNELGSAPLDITYGVTSWEVLKAAYDYGRSVRLATTEFGLQATSYFAPVYGQHDTGSNPLVDAVVFSNVYGNPNGQEQYAMNVLTVKKGSGNNSDEWSMVAKRIGGDIEVVNARAGTIGGDLIHFTGANNAGKILDYGTIPANVTGIDFIIESSVHTMLICFKVAANSQLAYVNVCNHEFSTLPTSENIFPNKGIPETFTPGNFYQLKFTNGVVLGVEIEPNHANNSLGGDNGE